MNPIFFHVVVFTVFKMCSAESEYEQDRTEQEYQCVLPRLENGRVRGKGRASKNTIRFTCAWKYSLVGAKYGHCFMGRWDVDIPICVKPGCKITALHPENALYYSSFRGALVKVLCKPGYFVHHNVNTETVYCDGYSWNGTFPDCDVWNRTPSTQCDFQSMDLCGWTNDINNVMKWQLAKAQDIFKSGPQIGNVMYFKTPSQGNSGGSGRFFSPVYPSFFSSKSCFKFQFIIYGETEGVLKVYLKSQGLSFRNTEPALWIENKPNYVWIEECFNLNPTQTNFQIVFEGLGSDIAISNVSLLLGEECLMLPEEVLPSSTSVTDSFDTISDFSCFGRCGEESVLEGTNVTSYDLDELSKCNCHLDCIKLDICCNDFTTACPPPDVGNEVTTIYQQPFTSRLDTTKRMETTTLRENLNTQSLVSTTKNVIPKSRITMPSTSLKTTLYRLTTGKSVVTEVPKTTKVFLPTQSTAIPKTTVTSTTKNNEQKMTISSSSTRNPKVNKTLIRFPARTIEGGKVENEISKTFPYMTKHKNNLGLPISSATVSNSQRIESKLKDSQSSSLMNIILGVIAVTMAVIFLLAFTVWKKQRRRSSLQSIAEDSDVRFLTSDENLDFTLAKPADDDL